MNGEQARELAAVAAFGDVSAAELRALESHTGVCAECREEMAAFGMLRIVVISTKVME